VLNTNTSSFICFMIELFFLVGWSRHSVFNLDDYQNSKTATNVRLTLNHSTILWYNLSVDMTLSTYKQIYLAITSTVLLINICSAFPTEYDLHDPVYLEQLANQERINSINYVNKVNIAFDLKKSEILQWLFIFYYILWNNISILVLKYIKNAVVL
jgi:hypothetical protein